MFSDKHEKDRNKRDILQIKLLYIHPCELFYLKYVGIFD